MEKSKTHAPPHHDEKQKTHAPTTMPCVCTGDGDPLPRHPINIKEDYRTNEGQNFGEREKQTTYSKGVKLGQNRRKRAKDREGGRNRKQKRERNNREVLGVKRNREKERERTV